ncbi:hypothetical protein FUA23_09230 [Neolewinella aurantiaca]|uniref:Uncharacterized protein n=1 Tax=Neolewinella aurantiaca TaxID=2602767 RepID=A0A5C7FT28_9BACT|nr:hypothetical protein [Neolewinella aurantiaca]TXF89625.1 hypothetical protein FUA23_09230 [Neolewinella aurantiaca]
MRYFLSFLLLLSLLSACNSGTGRQEIDLTERTIANPADGVGHYVYALSLPESIAAGETLEIQMDWRTVGPADMRKRYDLEMRLNGPSTKIYRVDKSLNTVGEANLVNWINYFFDVPANFPAGSYSVEVRLLDETRVEGFVSLGFQQDMAAGDGFWRVAEIEIEALQ